MYWFPTQFFWKIKILCINLYAKYFIDWYKLIIDAKIYYIFNFFYSIIWNNNLIENFEKQDKKKAHTKCIYFSLKE